MGVPIEKKSEYTTNEVAEILNVSDRTVRRIAQREKWRERRDIRGAIVTLHYDVSDIQEYIDKKDMKINLIKRAKTEVTEVKIKEIKQYDELPDWNKKRALAKFYLCTELAKRYEIDCRSKTEILKEFVQEVPEKYKDKLNVICGFSESSLRRWFSIYIKNPDRPEALAENYGHNKGKRNISLRQKELILKMYGDKNKPTVRKAWEQLYLMGEKVSYATVLAFVREDIPKFAIDSLREGKKENKDNYEPFALRNYLEKPNYIWMSDGHDLEMMCRNPVDNTISSPKLIIWQDHATRMWVGWALSWRESVEPIVESLKDGIEKWGRPEKLYTDNGRAYKSKDLKGNEELVGIYSTLGISEVHHALPYNAKAKAIERSFRDFKETFAKSFITYKGGHILERPERLKEIVKNHKDTIVEYEELKPLIENFIEFRNHEYYKIRGGHRGEGMNGRTPLERMNEELPIENRVMLDSDKLRLMCMYEEIRTVQQAGIELKGQLYLAREVFQWIGKKVRVKFDHRDLSKIYVYKITGEYLFEAEVRNKISFFGSIEEIKYINGLKKSHRKAVKKAQNVALEIREKDIVIQEIWTEDMKRLEQKREEKEVEYDLKKPWE